MASGTRRVGAGRLLSVLCAMRSPINSLSLHCIARHPGSLFTQTSLHSISRNHLHCAQLRHHRTSPHSTPINRESGCFRVLSKSTLRILTHASHLTARCPPSVGAALHIPHGAERSERERAAGRWGGAKPLRGQAPVTPNSLILHSLAISTHYKPEKV